MATFEINGKEHELKLTWDSVKQLNSKYDGGSMELIGKAMMGDLETFPVVIHAALIHTGEKLTQKSVEERIGELFDSGDIDALEIIRVSNEVVSGSFFYRGLIEKMTKGDKAFKKTMDQLLE